MSQTNDFDTLPPDVDPRTGEGIADPPKTLGGTLKQLGPGLIIAGSIVGSGELIATTKAGAQAGIALLWLIIIGCVIKVFVQIELGRYTISHGETSLAALNQVPGPRLRVNWILWFWLVMMLASIGQLGGIVGGVGQALALTYPIRGDYADAIRMPSTSELQNYRKWSQVFLSEWELKQYLQRKDAVLGDGELSAGLTASQKEWIRTVVTKTEKHLDNLNEEQPGLRGELLSATRELMEAEKAWAAARGSSSSDTEEMVEKVNSSLQELIRRANDLRVARLKEQPVSSENELGKTTHQQVKNLTEIQHERLLQGHLVLAKQLADLDRENNRSTEAMAAVVDLAKAEESLKKANARLEEVSGGAGKDSTQASQRDELKKQAAVAEARVEGRQALVNVFVEPDTQDDKIWATVVALFTAGLLYRGRYNMIQNISTVLVVVFTFITIGNVVSLQMTEQWHISTSELTRGLSFGLPQVFGEADPLMTALAAFGIIGVGATELITYPYWCIEKGYAKFTGPRNDDEGWVRRARGWMRVMLYDAFASMVVYTIATLAFFLMGVAVLHNEGRDPDGMRMVSTLATAYVPVFGEYARWLFLGGAVAVLYSTFMVANAGHSRMFTDAFKLFGLMNPHSQKAHDRSIGGLCLFLPLLCLAVYVSGANPVYMVLLAGTMQAIMLPMIGIGAVYFRYARTDSRLKPTPLWDLFLVTSCLGLLIAGGWGVYSRLF